MFKRLFALAATSFTTYVTSFAACVAAAVFIFWDGTFSETVVTLARGTGVILATGAIGGAVVSGIAVLKRRTIAQATLGRWLGVVAAAGAAHFGLLAGLVFGGYAFTSIVGVVFVMAAPPAAAGTLLFHRRALGVSGQCALPPA